MERYEAHFTVEQYRAVMAEQDRLRAEKDEAQRQEYAARCAEHRLEQQLAGAVEALRRIAAGHAHPSKLAGEALDALPPGGPYDDPSTERGQ